MYGSLPDAASIGGRRRRRLRRPAAGSGGDRPGIRPERTVQRHALSMPRSLPRLRGMNLRLLLTALLCLPLAAPCAEIYSWSDGNGVRHFTQEAPPKGIAFVRIPVESTSPSYSTPGNASAAPKKDTVLGGGPKTREAGLKLKAETLERCAKARERIRYLEEKTARRLFKPAADGGEPSRFTEEEFNAELEAAHALEAANCV